MESHTTARFWKSFDVLPKEVQEKTNRAFKIWSENQNHPSLHFKQVHEIEPIYSVRIGLYHRALGVKEENKVILFWIGTHEEYNNMISHL